MFEKNLHNIRFDTITKTVEVEETFSRLRLLSSWSWLGPQIFAYLGSYKVTRNVDGKIDAEKFLKDNVAKRAWDTGLYIALVKTERTKIVAKMTDRTSLKYSSLVPIYMAAQKAENNIKYSDWTNLKDLVPPRLLEAMQPKMDLDLSDPEIRDELLRLRIEACDGKDPKTVYNIKRIKDSILENFNPYAKHMLLQTWVAHPENRDPLMVLNPWDWDNMPEPLIPLDPFKSDDSDIPSFLK